MKPTCGAGQSWKQNLLQSLFFPIFSQDRSGDGKDDAPGSRRWLWKQFKMSEYTSQQKQLFLLQVRWGQPQCWCWGDFCPQKWFAVSQERLPLNTHCREGWWLWAALTPSFALSNSTAVPGVKGIVYHSSWPHFPSCWIRHFNKSKWCVFYRESFETEQDCCTLFKASFQEELN